MANLNNNNENGNDMTKKLSTKTPTQFRNVFRNEKMAEAIKNEKNPVAYDIFDGSEYMVFEPESFVSIGKVMRINSAELARKIYARFRQTFHDLKGVYIGYVMNNPAAFNVEFYFQKNDEACGMEEFSNLDNLSTSNSKVTDVFERQQTVQNRKIGKTYTLNNETRLILSKFMFGGVQANKPNNNKVWNDDNVIKEIHMSNGTNPFYHQYGTEQILVRVTKLNLNMLLAELFGNTMVTKTAVDDGGGDVNYSSYAAYQASFNKNCPDGTFMINITQFDRKAVEEDFVKENPMPQGYGGVRMYF